MGCGMKLMQTSDYPKPISKHDGKDVSFYVYATAYEAMQASVIAETIAVERYAQGQDYVYSIPGQMMKNRDGTYTVTVV